MMAFQNPCSGSTIALMYSSGIETSSTCTTEKTRFALDGSHVTSSAVKNRIAHLVYDHAALLASHAALRRGGASPLGAVGRPGVGGSVTTFVRLLWIGRVMSAWDERLLLIVESINRGRPVVAPLVSASLHHWTVIIGYDLDKKTLLGVNSLVGVPSRQPHGGTYFTVPFREFDRANSFEPLPGGLLGKVFALANKKDLGRWVLVYVLPRGTEETTGQPRPGPD